MKLVDDDLIASYRRPGRCEWCGRGVRMLCAAHVMSKGAGQVDIPCNLMSLGMDAVMDCGCHHSSHMGNEPTAIDMLAKNAMKYKTSQQAIVDLVWWVRRLPKNATKEQMIDRVGELSPAARRLAKEQLKL